MRKQNVFLSSLTSLYLIAGISCSSLAEDVYVDLSVLNALQRSDEFVSDNAPLFPDIKITSKKVSKPKVKKSKLKKIVRKKQTVSQAPKLKLEPAPKQVSAPVVEIKKEELPVVKTSTPDISSESAQVASQPVVENAFAEAKKQAEIAMKSSVQPQQPTDIIENTDNKSLNEEISSAPKTDISSTPVVEPLVSSEAINPEIDNKVEDKAEFVAKTPDVSVAVSQPQPLVQPLDRQILFADGSDELTPEHERQLDAIIANFSNSGTSTIAINSYNYDDGNDVFNKKRLSLRRIVAVRSYLLNRGYKNFMPKVINLTDDISKSNVVELEEIKN